MKDSLEIQATAIPTQNEISTLKQNLIKPKNKIANSLTTDDIVNFRSTNPNMKKVRTSTPEVNNLRSKNLLSKSSTNFNKDISEEASLRNKFQLCLGRLNDNSTKEIAFNQLKDIISTNPTESSLRIYLSALASFNQNCSVHAKEIHTLLYGYIASIFRENLMDPLDTPPNIIKTINRTLTHIRNLYMKESSYVIHKACSHSVLEIYDQCMPKDNLNTITLMFIDPMTSMLFSGTGNFSQMGAAICLSDFIYHLGQDDTELNKKLLIAVSGKIIPLAIKKSLDNQYLYEALYNLMQEVPFENFTNYLKELYDQLGFVIKQPKYNYMTKINSLKVLGLIARKLQSMTDIAIGYYQIEIIQGLESAAKDRVHKVQLAAQDALKEWRELGAIYGEIEQKKMQIATNQNDDGQLLPNQQGVGESFLMKNKDNIKKMDKLNFLRNLAKIAKTENKKIEYDSELPEKMREEVYKKGIGNILKLSNFLKNKNLKENNSSSGNTNSKSPMNHQGNQLKAEINDYLKHSNQVRKYDSKAKMPFNECDRISEVNEVKSEGNDLHYPNAKTAKMNMNIKPEIKFNEEEENIGDQMTMPIQNLQNRSKYNQPPMDEVEDNASQKSKNRLPKIEEAKDYPREQVMINNKPKSKKTYVNTKQIEAIDASQMNQTKQQIDLTGIKQELSKLILTSLSNSYTAFEKQITSKLYDMNNKINDVYLKLQDYEEEKKNNEPNANIYHINNEKFQDKSVNSPLIRVNDPRQPQHQQEFNSDKLNREQIYTEVMNNVKEEIEANKRREEESDSVITRKWKEALLKIELGQIENAYTLILNSGDDIYLLRLICITGPAFSKVSPEISKRILMRVNMISRSHQIQSLLINLIRHSLNENIFAILSQNEQNDILDSLFEFSGINTLIGSEAAELYTRITK